MLQYYIVEYLCVQFFIVQKNKLKLFLPGQQPVTQEQYGKNNHKKSL